MPSLAVSRRLIDTANLGIDDAERLAHFCTIRNNMKAAAEADAEGSFTMDATLLVDGQAHFLRPGPRRSTP